jgi:tRNA threonylcarbamoyladenosine biosynthesis protein TsaB
MNLLAIDTSADFCSVAASRGGDCFFRHERAGQRHAEMILGAVQSVLAEAGLALGDIEGIAFGSGPGSFTGLRVACGVTQGLALARGIGVVGVSTLLALAEESAETCAPESAPPRVIACIDAHMGEVYHAAYRRIAAGWEALHPPGVYKPEAVPQVPGDGWTGCGSGFAAHGGGISRRYASQLAALHPGMSPTARAVLRLARPRFEAGDVLDAADAVPVYIRDKVAFKPGER